MGGMKKYRKALALLTAATLTFSSLNPASIAFGAEEAAVDSTVDLESNEWHWAYSGGVLRMTNDSSASVELEDVKAKVTKVIIESGCSTMDDMGRCRDFPLLEEVEYQAPVTIRDMCFIKGNMFNNCPKLRKVTIGDAGLNSKGERRGLEINHDAFRDCTALKDVSLGLGVWHFGYMTFGNCTSLEKLVFSADMHNVRGDTFIGCSNLKELELDETNSYMRVIDNAVYEILDPYSSPSKRGGAYITPCLMFVPEGLIKANGGNYTVTKGTRDIQYWAIIGDPSLKNLTVGSTVEAIQHEAFYDNKNLKSITLPKSLKRIGQHAFGVMSENSMISELSEDIFEVMHNGDVHTVNSSITDVYYQGSPEDWKKIQFAWYSLNEGHLDQMSCEELGSIEDYLTDIGLPENVKIHYNSKLEDTETTLDDAINHVVSMSFNSKDNSYLKELGIDIAIKYTNKVTYNGRKHTLASDKSSDLTSNDIKLAVTFIDTATGKETEAFKVKKVKFKNNKIAAGPSSNKAPYFTIQLASTSSLDKAKKKALKKVNKLLKSKKETSTNLYFTIEPADISKFTSENYKNMQITEKKGAKKLKFKTLALQYKYLSGGETKTSWIKLKPCKKNNSAKKGDYTYTIVDDKTATLTGQHNYKGTVTLKTS